MASCVGVCNVFSFLQPHHSFFLTSVQPFQTPLYNDMEIEYDGMRYVWLAVLGSAMFFSFLQPYHSFFLTRVQPFQTPPKQLSLQVPRTSSKRLLKAAEDTEQQPAVKVKTEGRVKAEPLENGGEGRVKIEAEPQPLPPAPAMVEAVLGKAELMELHGLVQLPRNSHGKRHPILCNHCQGQIFEGRNRAKIIQHIGGKEHRHRWMKNRAEGIEQPAPAVTSLHEETKELLEGQCQGLRLGSSFGQRTRLGSDLLPVWKTYVQYANLQHVDGPAGNSCHKIVAMCNTNDWMLQSTNCKGDKAQVAGTYWGCFLSG